MTKLLTLLAVMLPIACGSGSERPTERAPDPPEEDRSSSYQSDNPGGPTPCGWLKMPNGQVEYVQCPSDAPRSPISDQPEQDNDPLATPPTFTDPRPDPPGDPPPW